jgi:endonuclease YncB( thermonuclease family)/outer membrane protein OmpA-like peptidoglycan-associated protein
MSGSDPYSDGESVQYRRGALMGFTVAESFMLIAFALLLLLALLRYTDAERDRAMGALNPAQQVAIAHAAFDGSLDDLLAVPRGEEERAALREGALIVGRNRMSDMEDAARLVAEEDIRRLAEAAAAMPEDLRRRLTDMVRLEDYKDLLESLEALKALDEGGVIVDAKEIETLRESEALLSAPGARDLAEAVSQLPKDAAAALADLAQDPALNDKLAALDAIDTAGAPIEQLRAALEIASQVEEGRTKAGNVEQEVAERIRTRTGALVANMGGEITETGDVVLPDALLFASGSAQIAPEMKNFLDGFCRPWFEILHNVGPSLAGVQIEGHASSEWTGLGPSQAYLENLRLSQERARAVFSFCLQLVGDDDVGLWARERLSAVGYSSARRIVENGKEDRARSRRVVFNIDADRSALFERIDAAKKKPFVALPSDLGDLLGDEATLLEGVVTYVRDGDTLEIGDRAIRLQGLHAPELKEAGGAKAATALRDMVLNRDVTCRLTGERSYDREIGICARNGEDVAINLVRAGLARDCPAFSHGRYAGYEPALVKTMTLPDYCLK